jgi:hypothetical protein
LSDIEARDLAVLLARYAVHELNQWDLWRIEVPGGAVFVDISLEPQQNRPESAYRTIWPLPSHLRGLPGGP